MPVIGVTKGPVFGGKGAVVIFGAKRPPSSPSESPTTKAANPATSKNGWPS